MPATESLIQSHGSPQTVTLRGIGECELRNGCLVVAATRQVLTGSSETTAKILAQGVLLPTERRWWQEWGEVVCDRMSSQDGFRQAGAGLRRSNRVVEKMGAA